MTDHEGYVYVIRKSSTDEYKIGVSVNVERRLSEIARSIKNLQLIHAVPSDNPYLLERQLHSHLEAKRLYGEWFRLDSSDLVALQQVTHSHHGKAIVQFVMAYYYSEGMP